MVVFGTGMNLEESCLAELFQIATKLHEAGLSESYPNVISSARVPIIKFKDVSSGIMVDMSFEVSSATESTILVKKWVKWYPMLRPMTIVLKYYLKQRYLNETWTGGLGSYTLVVMILSFLQMHTPSRGREPKATDGEDLATLTINFLQFYGAQFDYFSSVISVLNGGHYLRKEDKNWVSEAAPDALSIENPIDPEVDIAAGAYRIRDAREVFMEGFYKLKTQRWSHTHSFLACLFEAGPTPGATRQAIAGDYASHILHNGISLSIDPVAESSIPLLDIAAPSDASLLPAPASGGSATSGPPFNTNNPVSSSNGNKPSGGRSPTKHHNRSRNRHSNKHASPPTSPTKSGAASQQKQQSSQQQSNYNGAATNPTSPRASGFDRYAPEYSPLFPPLPTKAPSSPPSPSSANSQNFVTSSPKPLPGVANAS